MGRKTTFSLGLFFEPLFNDYSSELAMLYLGRTVFTNPRLDRNGSLSIEKHFWSENDVHSKFLGWGLSVESWVIL